MNWRAVKLGDIVERMTNGSSLDQYEIQSDGMLPITRIETIAFEEINFDRVKYVKANSDELEKYGLLRGDILFSHINSDKHLGKTAIHKSNEKIIHGINLLLIRTNADCDSFFLNYYFKYYRGLGKFIEIAQRAVNQSSINQKKLKDINVLLPLLPEQKRIVAKLDDLFAHLDQLKARLQNIPTLLKQFRAAVLTHAVTGKLTEEWRKDKKEQKVTFKKKEIKTRRDVPSYVPLNEYIADLEYPSNWAFESVAYLLSSGLLMDVKDGNHGSNHPKSSDFTDLGIPFITATHVRDFKVDYENSSRLSGVPLSKIKIGRSQTGDVLYTHKGSVGRVAIATVDAILSPQVTYYRTDNSILLNKYLAFYLSSSLLSRQVDPIKAQTTRDFVPIRDQYSLFILIPSIEEQKEIVCRVESLFAVADRIGASYNTLQEKIDHLPQAILSKAFRGELTN